MVSGFEVDENVQLRLGSLAADNVLFFFVPQFPVFGFHLNLYVLDLACLAHLLTGGDDFLRVDDGATTGCKVLLAVGDIPLCNNAAVKHHLFHPRRAGLEFDVAEESVGTDVVEGRQEFRHFGKRIVAHTRLAFVSSGWS